MESHPLRMRGLKRLRFEIFFSYPVVASFTDAWIETRCISADVESFESHPLRMRGLKQRGSS